jgi:16S rRNA (cytosine967-C5)-methyltransferase
VQGERTRAAADGGARAAAVRILVRTEAGAYAAPLLERALEGLERREERALCTELVYGALRWQGELDYALGRLARRSLARLPAPVRAALRLGAYQLLHLERVPAHAAVSSTVELVRAHGQGALTGFANGVLRRLAREGPPKPPDDPVAALAVRYSHPVWLVRRWLEQYGEERAVRLLAYDQTPAPVTVRVRPTVGRDALAERWRAAGVACEPTRLSPYGLRLRRGQAVSALPGYGEGVFVVQDEGAMAAVEWLGARPGERVVDACAGRGTKTLGLLDAVGKEGGVLAVDVHAGKLGALAREARRRGHAVRRLEGADLDGEAPAGLALAAVDGRRLGEIGAARGARRVLLDAPCTGLGVLRRRPELRWRRRPEDAVPLAALQTSLLWAACEAVAVGGEVLYVTCTTDPRENEEVVAAVLARRGDVEALPALPEDVAPPGAEVGPDGSVRLFGPDSGTDGFFFARLVRRR